MSDEITQQLYWKEVRELAEGIVEEALADNDGDREAAEEEVNDTRLHETIDGHQWVIYYAYNLDVLKYSDNAEYMSDNFGGESLEASIKEGGIDMLHTRMAFWALYADVQGAIIWPEVEA